MDNDHDDELERTKPQTELKKEVIKHSSAIHVKNSINLLQRRTWNVLLANAFNELRKKTIHKITIKNLHEMLSFESKNDKYLKDAIEGLIACVVTWNVLGKDKKSGWAATSLLADAEVKDGLCTYSYSERLKNRLFNPSMYARISLSIQNKFTSKYSLALYELCLDYLNPNQGIGETPRISIQTFRELMGVTEEQYLDFKDFNKRIIQIAVSEVNRLSDLDIKVQFFREVRRIISLKFHIKKKNNFPRLLPAGNAIDEKSRREKIDSLHALLKKKTATLKTVIASALDEMDYDCIQSNIFYANENAEKNYSLYLKRALKYDWALEKREENAFEAQEQQQKDGEWITRYIEKITVEQTTRDLPKRLMSLEQKKRKVLLKRAETKILGSKYREFLLQDGNKELLKKAIQLEAINEMKS
jgi:plasmid replication initiation protein